MPYLTFLESCIKTTTFEYLLGIYKSVVVRSQRLIGIRLYLCCLHVINIASGTLVKSNTKWIYKERRTLVVN